MIGGAISANPTYPAYDKDGKPYQYASGTNPLITLGLEKDITTNNRVVGSISPSFRIIEGLVYKLNFGVDNSNSVQDLQSLPNTVPFQEGRLETRYTTNRNSLIENYLTYTYSNTNHSFTGLVGHSYQKIFVQGRKDVYKRQPRGYPDKVDQLYPSLSAPYFSRTSLFLDSRVYYVDRVVLLNHYHSPTDTSPFRQVKRI